MVSPTAANSGVPMTVSPVKTMASRTSSFTAEPRFVLGPHAGNAVRTVPQPQDVDLDEAQEDQPVTDDEDRLRIENVDLEARRARREPCEDAEIVDRDHQHEAAVEGGEGVGQHDDALLDSRLGKSMTPAMMRM